MMAKIMGIGGAFSKSTAKSAELSDWYPKYVARPLENFGGAILRWRMITLRTEASRCGGSQRTRIARERHTLHLLRVGLLTKHAVDVVVRA